MNDPKKVLLIGSTGAGKSTVGNILLGLPPYCNRAIYGFVTGGNGASVTDETRGICGRWLGAENQEVLIIDTPGHGDTQGRDEAQRRRMIETLRQLRPIDAVIWVRNFTLARNDMQEQEFIGIYEEAFGRQRLLRNLAVLFTYCHVPRGGQAWNNRANAIWSALRVDPSAVPVFSIGILDADFVGPTTREELRRFRDEEAGLLWAAIQQFSRSPLEDFAYRRGPRQRLQDSNRFWKIVAGTAVVVAVAAGGALGVSMATKAGSTAVSAGSALVEEVAASAASTAVTEAAAAAGTCSAQAGALGQAISFSSCRTVLGAGAAAGMPAIPAAAQGCVLNPLAGALAEATELTGTMMPAMGMAIGAASALIAHPRMI